MALVEVKNAYKYYMIGEKKTEILKRVSLSVNEGEFLVILGPSGSGKSTLLNMIGGLDDLDGGKIVIDNVSYQNQNDVVLSEYRRKKLGFIFQSYNLIPVLSVYENIVMPIVLDDGKVDEAYICEIMGILSITEKKNSFPKQLSGGEQQRVAIARALANRPQIVLADEPTGNLDTNTGKDVLRLLTDGIRKYGQTLIMITHNEEIAKMADRVVYIENGELYEGIQKI